MEQKLSKKKTERTAKSHIQSHTRHKCRKMWIKQELTDKRNIQRNTRTNKKQRNAEQLAKGQTTTATQRNKERDTQSQEQHKNSKTDLTEHTSNQDSVQKLGRQKINELIMWPDTVERGSAWVDGVDTPHSKKDPGLSPSGIRLYCVELACSPHVCIEFFFFPL